SPSSLGLSLLVFAVLVSPQRVIYVKKNPKTYERLPLQGRTEGG
ncbi:hypothetical protein LINPERHAP1_LOCUS15326, partial [Linum perenne]